MITLPKSYSLPPARSIALGIILILVGLMFFSMPLVMDFRPTLWENLQRVFLDFYSVGSFIGSLLMLVLKAGFIVWGCYYLKNIEKVERARLTENGFFYREIPQGSRYRKALIDLGPLSYTPYNRIVSITYKKTFWMGGQLFMTIDSGPVSLLALGVLKYADKTEIAEEVNARISAGHQTSA